MMSTRQVGYHFTDKADQSHIAILSGPITADIFINSSLLICIDGVQAR